MFPATLALCASGMIRPWFTHGTSLSRDRSLLRPLADCLKRGRFVPVTERIESFTVASGNGSRALVELTHEQLPDGHLESPRTDWAWIGRRQNGEDVFAVSLGEPAVRAVVADEPALGGTLSCAPLRNVADTLVCMDEAAILSSARGYLHFHSVNRFCAKCGKPTAPTKAGGARVCTNSACGHKVYPRVDPAAIVLVTSPASVDGRAQALLGRKKIWPQGRFSTLSGFAELGESIEEALCREVEEESGVRVKPGSLQFACSQPWLFPQSLMVGFVAEAEPDALRPSELPGVAVDDQELEACGWFSREYVAERLGGGAVSLVAETQGTAAAEFHIPGPVSLANVLISHWAAGELGSAERGDGARDAALAVRREAPRV
jgi:NAD+ diphosphatase